MLSNQSDSEQHDFIEKLGQIVGVAELKFRGVETAFDAPVLVAENAFFFCPWTAESSIFV